MKHRANARTRSVLDVGPGDFVKVHGVWHEILSNSAFGQADLPRNWLVETKDAVYQMIDCDLYARLCDFEGCEHLEYLDITRDLLKRLNRNLKYLDQRVMIVVSRREAALPGSPEKMRHQQRFHELHAQYNKALDVWLEVQKQIFAAEWIVDFLRNMFEEEPLET
jgi:hypothetical protein